MHAAREIMETQEWALSIRKIAAMIQQTPGIIYHLFRKGADDAWWSYRRDINISCVHHTDHGI